MLRRLKRRIAALPQREGKHVRRVRVHLPPRRLEPGMAGVVVHAQQHRLVAGGRRLQARGELGRYPRGDAWIVDTRRDQHSWVLDAVLHVRIRTHREQRLEPRLGLDAAVLRLAVRAADMLRFETTADGPYSEPEYGSVKTESGFKALFAMSPYAHVQNGIKYPAVLITTGINDPRVPAWIPAKFAARLQAATASDKPVLLRVDYDAGHAGLEATRRQVDSDTADMLAFALWQSGDPAFQPTQH